MNLQQIHKEWEQAPYGAKNDVLKRWSQTYGVEPRTIRRKLKESGLGSGRIRSG